MKFCISVLVFTTIFITSFSQSIPQNSNITDTKGLRQGTWTVTYNVARQVTQYIDSIAFYRIVSYKDDKPAGVVRNYYRSGQIQWEGGLLTDRPQDVKNGLATWYRVDGSKEVVRLFENGKQISEVFFNLDGSEAIVNWDSLNRLGEESYFSGEYEKSLQYFGQAVVQAEKEFGTYHLNYALALNNLGILFSSYKHNYAKAEILYHQALSIYEKVGKEHPDYGTVWITLHLCIMIKAIMGKPNYYINKLLA